MKYLILFLTFCLLLMNSVMVAQIKFQKTFLLNNHINTFYDVRQTTDNGYVMTGGSFSNSNIDDVLVVKTNAMGDTLWTRTYGGTFEYEVGKSIVQTFDGGYFIGCQTWGFTTQDIDYYLIRTDGNGDTLWTRTNGHPNVGIDYCFAVQQTSDSNFIVFGTQGKFEADFYLNKWNANGSLMWAKSYSIPANQDLGFAVQQASDNGFIMGGMTQNDVTGDSNVFVVKVDTGGIVQWARTYGGDRNDICYSIQQTADGGYVIAGTTLSFGAGNLDIYIIKINSAGDTLWTHTYGNSNIDESNSIRQTSDHGFIVSGSTYDLNSNSTNLLLFKIDSIGNLVWSKSYGSSSIDKGNYAMQTNDGGFIACGRYDQSTYRSAYLIKTDSLGSSGCNENTASIVKSNTATTIAVITPVSNALSLVKSTATIVGNGLITATLCGTDISENSKNTFFNIFPNPTVGDLIISFDQILDSGLVQIIDAFGKLVHTVNIRNESRKQLNVKNMAQGIYFVKVYDGERSSVEKLIVE